MKQIDPFTEMQILVEPFDTIAINQTLEKKIVFHNPIKQPA